MDKSTGDPVGDVVGVRVGDAVPDNEIIGDVTSEISPADDTLICVPGESAFLFLPPDTHLFVTPTQIATTIRMLQTHRICFFLLIFAFFILCYAPVGCVYTRDMIHS